MNIEDSHPTLVHRAPNTFPLMPFMCLSLLFHGKKGTPSFCGCAALLFQYPVEIRNKVLWPIFCTVHARICRRWLHQLCMCKCVLVALRCYATILSLLSFPARFYCSSAVRTSSSSYFLRLFFSFHLLHNSACIYGPINRGEKFFVFIGSHSLMWLVASGHVVIIINCMQWQSKTKFQL